ncbi:MAG: hypothetical protein Q9220_003889 [cf. Caloplaca sp. 1 TL-2023]
MSRRPTSLPVDVPDPTNSSELGGKFAFHATDDGLCTIAKEGKVLHRYQVETGAEIQEYCKNEGMDVLYDYRRPYLVLDHFRSQGTPDGHPGIAFANYTHRTMHQMTFEFEMYRAEFEDSGVEEFLKTHIEKVAKERHLINIVSFGTGSLQTCYDDTRRNAHLQIAALVTMLASINKGRKPEDLARCFSQEPQYTDLDKEFLRTHGIEAVDDPEGWELMSSNSVYCEWGAYDFVARKVSQGPWPVIIINNLDVERIRVEKDLKQKTGPDEGVRPNGEVVKLSRDKTLTTAEAQRVLDMFDSCEHKAFPPSLWEVTDPLGAFKRYTIYWRTSHGGSIR